MATEYKDGTFGETLPLPEALKRFKEALETGTAKAFHVGTPQEIEAVKSEKDTAGALQELKDRLTD